MHEDDNNRVKNTVLTASLLTAANFQLTVQFLPPSLTVNGNFRFCFGSERLQGHFNPVKPEI